MGEEGPSVGAQAAGSPPPQFLKSSEGHQEILQLLRKFHSGSAFSQEEQGQGRVLK